MTTQTRQSTLNDLARLLIEAEAITLPALTPRPRAATLAEFEAWEAISGPEQDAYDRAAAERDGLFAEAFAAYTAAQLPERVWLKAEVDGEAWAVRAHQNGEGLIRFRLSPWQD